MFEKSITLLLHGDLFCFDFLRKIEKFLPLKKPTPVSVQKSVSTLLTGYFADGHCIFSSKDYENAVFW